MSIYIKNTNKPLTFDEINDILEQVEPELREEVRNVILQYNNTLSLYKKETGYTFIPIEYYINSVRLKHFNYVKEVLGLEYEHKLTWQELFKACSTNIELFAYYMLGLNLRPYQIYDLHVCTNKRYVVKAWSRRLGKSFDNRILLLWSVFFNKFHSDIGGTTWNIVLQDQDTGNDIYIEPLHELMERGDKVTLNNFKGRLGYRFFTSKLTTPRDKTGKVRANKISFRIPHNPIADIPEGICRITTYPPTKKAIGHEGNIIGDEVAKWKDNTAVKDEFKFFDQLTAILKDTDRYKAIYSSTPEGENDLFAEIFNSTQYYKLWFPYWIRQDNNWIKEMSVTKQEAIKKGRLHIFQQEFEAKFISISTPFFPTKIITNNIYNTLPKLNNIYHSIGIDWGGTEKSQTAICIIAWDTKPDSTRYVVFTKTYKINEDLENFIPDLIILKNKYNIKWVVPDNKGGRWAIPQLKKLFPGRVEPFNFTTDKKPGYELLRQAFVNGLIKIPPDNELIAQLLTLTDELKPASKKNKDDLADALMLAHYPTAIQNHKKFNIIPFY